MKVSEVLEKYIALRDKRTERKKDFALADAADKELMERIEAKLIEVFDRAGVDSLQTPAGTAFKSSQTSVTIADKEVFSDFIKESERWELADIRPSKEAVEQYKVANEAIPPGLNYRQVVVVNVRRSA